VAQRWLAVPLPVVPLLREVAVAVPMAGVAVAQAV